MNYRNDKISDAIEVLAAMRSGFESTRGKTPAELRIAAVKAFAEKEWRRTKRFKNEISAVCTITDALGRRLRPDIRSVGDFDALAGRWLTSGCNALKDILAKHSRGPSQQAIVREFFLYGYLARVISKRGRIAGSSSPEQPARRH